MNKLYFSIIALFILASCSNEQGLNYHSNSDPTTIIEDSGIISNSQITCNNHVLDETYYAEDLPVWYSEIVCMKPYQGDGIINVLGQNLQNYGGFDILVEIYDESEDNWVSHEFYSFAEENYGNTIYYFDDNNYNNIPANTNFRLRITKWIAVGKSFEVIGNEGFQGSLRVVFDLSD